MPANSNETFFSKRRRIDPYRSDEDSDDVSAENLMRNGLNIGKTYDNNSNDLSNGITQKYGMGARLLSKMGYVEGQGLGKNGSGIAEPIKAEQRPTPNAGLGMLSSLHLSEDEGYSESSSDDLSHVTTTQTVSFNKTTTECLNETNKSRREMERLVRSLEGTFDVRINKEYIDNFTHTKEDEMKLLSIMRELLVIEDDIKAMDSRRNSLKSEITDIEEEESILDEINSGWKKCLKKNDILPIVDLILKLSNDQMIDHLISRLIEDMFRDVHWDPLDVSNAILNQIVPLVDVLKYQMDTNSETLNRTQTTIFKLVFDKLSESWMGFDVTRQGIGIVITLLMDYEPILEFTSCLEYIREKFIQPKLIESIKEWNICDLAEVSPRNWVFDAIVIIDDDTRKNLENIVQQKFYCYCNTWHHRRSSNISNSNLAFIKELIGSRYSEIVNRTFLKKFVDQLWENHFDPIIELENWKSISDDEGTIYYLLKLQEYKNIFDEDSFRILIRGVFNEINKILYQWGLFANPNDKKKAKSWFNAMMNSMFKNTLPCGIELQEIRKTLEFLQESDNNPIHDESFDLQNYLDLREPKKIEKNHYKFDNIPLRKVIPTFKDVLLDYCEEKGYSIEKLDNSYTVIPWGAQREALVPVFQVKSEKTYLLAIKEDILWIKKKDGKFAPAYLYEIV